MEKPAAPGAAGGPSGESPGGATLGVPGGFRAVEADAGPPSSVVPFHGPESSLHSGGTVTRSPESSQPSGGVAVLGSGHPGEVADLGPGSGPYPGGLNAPFPETSVSGTYSLGSEGSGAYGSGRGPRSESTSLHSHKPYEDRPQSILKNSGSILTQKSPTAEKKKSQWWDEMNILATYHPADKDYGFMNVDEPSTPYHRPQDSDKDPPGASSLAVAPELLAERLAKMDTLHPKVLQYGDNRSSSSGAPDHFSKTHSSDFDNRRKAHYDEGKFFKTRKSFLSDDNKHNNKGGGGGQGVMLDLERRNQCPAPATIRSDQEIDLQQRKEYYIKGRYLRCSPYPELEEDTEDEHEQQDSSANLNWVVKNPISTEVRLLDHPGSPAQDHKATKDRLKVTVTKLQPGAALSSRDNGSRSESGSCQWLVSKGLTWQSPESLETEPGSHPKSPNQNQC